MTVISTRLMVAPDGSLSLATPLPPGEHDVTVTISQRPRKSMHELPIRDGVWNDSISLRREDIYGDDGR